MHLKSPIIQTLGFENCNNMMDLQNTDAQEDKTILELVKKQYRKKALLLHPDKNRGKDTSADMAVLNDAYVLLLNEITNFNPNDDMPYHSTSAEPFIPAEWQEYLSTLFEKYRLRHTSLLDLIAEKINIYDINSTNNNKDRIKLLMKTYSGRDLIIIFHYNAKTKTVNPSIFYSALIQLILDATNGQSLLIGLTNKESRGSMLFATSEENGEQTALCIQNNIDSEHLEMLRQVLGLRWIVQGGKEITFDHPEISIREMYRLSFGEIFISKGIPQLSELPSPSIRF